MEVNQARFARIAGVSRPGINQAISRGRLVISGNGTLDTNNPLNRDYLEKHQWKQTSKTEEPPTAPGTERIPARVPHLYSPPAAVRHAMSDAQVASASGVAEEMLGFTIRELIMQHGTINGIERYVKILRDLTTADEKDQRMQERRGVQIPRDFVTSHVFTLLEQMMNKLLDVPARIVDSLIAHVMSDDDDARQKIINEIRDNLTVVITDSKELVVRQLEGAKGKEDDGVQEGIQDLKEQMSELAEAREN